ncbi:GrlR family regulatory protein [Bradyrhizobium sp. Tv2a-2]|uniref:GrlR family regulatory protein n=1 Tax=Bradyrhizobium sp. Tv2a-2 TaxID=113395 RepID=UPI0004216217|nr:GrlR family regulatory protein [Bradyrhizobium sp. Tv2a-2]
MFGGFYTVKFQLGEAQGRSVMYVRDGRMLGGNSAFAHIGTYQEIGDEIAIVVDTVRHNPDPNYPAMAGTDDATLLARGRRDGEQIRFEGGLRELPGVPFQSVMMPIKEQPLPIAGGVGEDCIRNGLYSIHVRTLDGVEGGLTGVMLLNDGRILGGDACFYYLGTYTSENGRWKGQILNQEHTPATGDNPIFGGHEVGIGFSGRCDADGASWEATALVGKRSLRLTAALKLMRRL